LVAARDQVVVQLKREKLAAELNQRNSQKSHRSDEIMNVKLNLEELELIVEALNQQHDALSSGRVIFKKPCVLQNRPAAYLL
jgi:hypothetical protein